MRLLTFGFAVFFLGVVVMADLGSIPPSVKNLTLFPGGDKLAHFLLAGTLAFLANASFSPRRIRFRGRQLLFLGSYMVAIFLTCEEFSQLFMAARSFSWGDLSADFLGILLAGGGAIRFWRCSQ